jgi:protein-S-isoprenylcysteine O-methyltransferase Ste14
MLTLIIADIIVGICLLLLFISISINFAIASEKTSVKKEKKSIVETGTMTLFAVVFYIIIRFSIGSISISNVILTNVLMIFGTLLFSFGCFVNIAGRFNLGKNWANQVTIYKKQTFISFGMYRFVRHPLYASIILMFYAACLIHPNYIAFLATTFIFIPFMYYRAKQEEVLLTKTFKDYSIYQKKVGMLFPKILK